MTAVLVVTILAIVFFVLLQIARITVDAARQWRDDERAAGELVDQPAAEEAGQPAEGMGR